MRWLALLLCCLAVGCYAIPSEHDITSAPLSDADIAPDADDAPDAEPSTDADVDSGESDAASPEDGGMDARVDAGADGSSPEAGPADAGRDADASACGTCPGDASLCSPNGQCVQCTADDAGCASGQHCTTAGRCVACLENKHCTAADASVCSLGTGTCRSCTEGDDSQCTHITGKGVCAAGECVQCRRDKAAACNTGGTQYVCDATTRACDFHRRVQSKTLCNVCMSSSDTDCRNRLDCVSDDECQPGQACVNVPAGAGKKVCQAVLVTSNSCPSPYTASTANAVQSADGPSVRVCTFAAMTTCLAHAHYRQERCGTAVPGTPTQDQPGTANDAKCGEPNLADGYCSWSEALKQYLCTVPCNASYLDCPNADVTRPEQCDTVPTPDRCTL